jgi:hypothetical protein
MSGQYVTCIILDKGASYVLSWHSVWNKSYWLNLWQLRDCWLLEVPASRIVVCMSDSCLTFSISWYLASGLCSLCLKVHFITHCSIWIRIFLWSVNYIGVKYINFYEEPFIKSWAVAREQTGELNDIHAQKTIDALYCLLKCLKG